MPKILVSKATTHNLKDITCSIPHGSMCCVTGVSGSGKSSFAFDTLFIEGERRYIQSLSHQAKRIIGSLPQPSVESIQGLTPTIALEQKTSGGTPRSTIGTVTEIYDYLRVLYAKCATPYCPVSQEPLISQTKKDILFSFFEKFSRKKMILLAPWGKELRGTLKDHFEKIEQKGFSRIFLDETMYDISSITHIDPQVPHTIEVVIDRVEISEAHRERLEESLSTALELGNGVCFLLDPESQEKELFSQAAFAKTSGRFYPKLEPQDFSFNTPTGMCDSCQGLGITNEFILEKIIDPNKSVSEDFCSIAGSYQTQLYRNIFDNLAHIYSFSVTTPWKKLSKEAQHVLLYGTEKKWTKMVFINPKTGGSWYDNVRWQGILHEAKLKYQEAKSERYKERMGELLHTCTCNACKGSRIKPYPSAARFHGFTLAQLTSKTIDDLLTLFSSLSLSHPYAEEILFHIYTKLSFLHKVGTGYLSLERTTPSLSGGELQRVKLASHLGSGLTGITYVLDEPSIGLHPHDTHKLIEALLSLKQGGNTVIVVEHDPSIMLACDWILDFGPGAGTEGGNLLFEGFLSNFKKAKNSVTADYLYEKKKIERAFPPRKASSAKIVLKGASLHNLKKDTLTIPLGLFVAITGVSGSGKSSLLLDTLYPALSNKLMYTNMAGGPHTSLEGAEHLDKVIHIDQSPIGRTPRSNPATYSGVFDDIRLLFASLPECKVKGWAPGRFSFNVKEGSCPVCAGMGQVQLNVDFLEDTWVTCTECQGKRFDPETLSVLYKGKSIHDVLTLTCREACSHFSAIPSIRKGLEILCRVGLEYLQLGQSSTTLSGGEAQRLKIARELGRPATGKTLYILDEPTTGLHFHDLSLLLLVLHELVDKKNTVLVIEHNMDLVKTADWVIDLGPSAGKEGGNIVAEGTPKDIAKLNTPTGEALCSLHKKKKASTSLQEKKELNSISLFNAHQHNLKNLSFSLPKNAIITVCGPSGSGKASLAFDTLFAEGQRKYVESLPPYARQFIKQMPKPLLDGVKGLLPAIAIEHRKHASNPRSTLGTMTEIYDYLRIIFARHGIAHCPKTHSPIRTISKERLAEILLSWEPKRTLLFAPLLPLKSSAFSLQVDSLKALGYTRIRIDGKMFDAEVDTLPETPSGRLIQIDVLIDRLTPSPDEKSRLVQSIGEACRLSKDRLLLFREEKETLFNLAFAVEETGESYPEITPHTFSFSSPHGACSECDGLGVVPGVHHRSFKKFSRFNLFGVEDPDLIAQGTPCPSCQGTRLNPLARNVTLQSTSLPELCKLPLSELALWLSRLKKDIPLEKTIEHAVNECSARVLLSEKIGIQYLSLSRCANTLSMGEAQRVHFLSQIGSRLSELLYVIDEPTAGLHPDDIIRLLSVMTYLKNLGNTLLVIEHDPQFLAASDHILELGPGSAMEGGSLLFEGPFDKFLSSKKSQTAPFFTKTLTPKSTSIFPNTLSFSNVSCHNIQNISFTIPINAIVCLAGVSGSGKSTILFDVVEKTLLASLNKTDKPFTCSGDAIFERVVSFDQKPHGTTSRSDLLSFLDLSSTLREFYASLPESEERGLLPSHFSTCHKNGMCPDCYGLGYQKIDMYFLPPVEIPCKSCQGLRFKEKTLEVEYNGVSIGKLLTLPLNEACTLFPPRSKITRTLSALIELGLHYLTLGQETNTLSFGEVQRVKIAKELAIKRRKNTLYLFDEPTNGLHPQEVERLIKKLNQLKEIGHSILLVEHNMTVIAECDYSIELTAQGQILTEGAPSELIKNDTSRIGYYLKKMQRNQNDL